MADTKERVIKIRTSYDEMEAYITVPFIPVEETYTKEEIMDAIRESKVKIGIDESAIDRLIEERIFGHEMLFAQGKPVVDGQDGFFQFNFNLDFNSKPMVRQDGTVDYWSIHTVEIVEEGQVIAIYHEPVDGSHGMTVTGKLLMGKRGRPLPPLTGKGFDRSEDNQIYTANITGKIEKNGNRIMILPVYEIFGNVDMSTGNIDFRGDVIVHGNVSSGLKIHATGSVTIDGVAEACTIEAGKDVILRGGFLGGYKGVIRSKGCVYAKFLEYATVEAEGVIEATSALNCNITCYDHIYMNGKTANVVGGVVYGTSGIEVCSLGNYNEIKTDVQTGVNMELLRKMADIQTRIDQNQEMIFKINVGIAQFDEIGREKNIDVRNDDRRVSLLRTRIAKQAELAKDTEDLIHLKMIAEKADGAMVRVYHDVYPGVTVSINNNRLKVKEQQSSLEFQEHRGKIMMFAIES